MTGNPKSEKPVGRLFVVATPIGNLEDITLRALRILREVSAIACEDTRHTVKLLNRYGIKNKLISYYHPREQRKIPRILSLLQQGKDVALVSDAGTPGIADPGFPLVREALSHGIEVTPIPGPCAAAAALSAAGLPMHRFFFLNFPSPRRSAERKLLQSFAEETATLVLYLPARRLSSFLATAQDALGDRRMVLAREITKVHEEFIRGTISELIATLENRPLKGEVTLLVEGRSGKKARNSSPR